MLWTLITGLAAAVAAIVAIVISFLQWMTAQTKVALDIHASRYAVYMELREAVNLFLRELNFSNDVHAKFLDAQSRARFLFGAEVDQYLEEIRRLMIAGHVFDRYSRGVQQPQERVDQQIERLNQINAFFKDIDAMFVPYMRLEQKMPPWWWTSLASKIAPWRDN
jgi:hypothetical protein